MIFADFKHIDQITSLHHKNGARDQKNIRITIKIKCIFFAFQVFFFVLLAAVEVIPFLSGLLQRSAKDALNTKAVMELSEPALYTVNCPKFARKSVKYFAVNPIHTSGESFLT